MKIPTAKHSPQSPADDGAMVRWHDLTEALIFAAPYGTEEYMQILDRTGRRYSRDDALRRCKALAKAIDTDYADLPVRLLRCHAANDDPAFRHRYGDLLPRRPATASRAERRTGISEAQRMADADDLAASMRW
jgi:hypothetical protein